jgi:hypothetical protein
MTAPTRPANGRMSVDKAADQLLPAERQGRNTLRSAMVFAQTAHDGDVAELRDELRKMAANDPDRLADLTLVLAGLVDIDRTASDLLAWMCPPGQMPRPRLAERRCGTLLGYIHHLKAGEDPCPPCRAEFLGVSRGRSCRCQPGTTQRRWKNVIQCPSPAAYDRHKRRGEEPCAGCKKAKRLYWADYAAKRPGKTSGADTRIKGCGTRAGYDRHRRLDQDICDPCAKAARAYWAANSAKNYRRRPAKLAACQTQAAKRRHRLKRETCLECWPDHAKKPTWYEEASFPQPAHEMPATVL